MLGQEEQELNISIVRQGISPFLTGWEPTFEEVLDWLKFSYTIDRTWGLHGACVHGPRSVCSGGIGCAIYGILPATV